MTLSASTHPALPQPRIRPALRRGLLATAASALVGGVVVSGAPAAAAATPAAGPSASPGAATVTLPTVTLPTGDRVTAMTTNGVTSYAAAAAPGGGGTFESYDTGGDHYVVPATAVPYLGRQLDRSLFDVTALARDGLGGAGRLPVSLTFAPGATPSAPPGVTLTTVSGSTASGYLADGPAFAATLRAHVGADVGAGRAAGTGDLAAGLTGMSLRAAGAPATVTPHYPLHPLTITGVDGAGKPVQAADVLLMNTDQVSKQNAFVPVVNGIGRVEVPTGHYAAVAVFFGFDPSGTTMAMRTVTEEATVADTGTASVTVDERTSTSRFSAIVPKPTKPQLQTLTLYRRDVAGGGTPFGLWDFLGTTPLYVNPQPKPANGTQHVLYQWAGDAANPADKYRYDVAFALDDGVAGTEAFTTTQNTVAEIHSRFSADPASPGPTGAYLNGALDPTALAMGYVALSGADGQPAPSDLTQYVGTADTGGWWQGFDTAGGIFLQASPHTYAAGHRYSQTWAHGPLAPGLGQYTGPAGCDACGAGGTLSLIVPMARDSVADHMGDVFAQSAVHFTLYQGDKVVFDKDNRFGAVVTGIPAVPTTYRGVLDVDLSNATGISQATRSHTEETVQYTPTPAPGSTLPAEDFCQKAAPTDTCHVLGAMTLGYDLATDQSNTTSSPVQALGLTVGHVAYDGVSSRSPVTNVTVSVSFDGGTTWQPAPVFGAAGHYAALWQNPASAAGTSPSLRVTAQDAAGDAVDQTVTAAYTIAKSTH